MNTAQRSIRRSGDAPCVIDAQNRLNSIVTKSGIRLVVEVIEGRALNKYSWDAQTNDGPRRISWTTKDGWKIERVGA